jgi:hypothetical protein
MEKILKLSVRQEKLKELYLWIEPGKNVMYPDGKQDNTHFSIKGATMIAQLAIEDLKENNLIPAKYFRNQNH